jgi:hypothetical protein
LPVINRLLREEFTQGVHGSAKMVNPCARFKQLGFGGCQLILRHLQSLAKLLRVLHVSIVTRLNPI